MGLTRDSILAADDLPRELIKLPEWGGDAYVRTMNGSERDALEVFFEKAKKTSAGGGVRARLAALCLCDASGKRIFGDGDDAALGAKSAKLLDRIVDAAMRLNGMRASDVEDLEKNSSGGPSAASGSD